MKVVARPIDVVAWFDKDGSLHPVRFRILKEEMNKVIKIDRVISKEKEKLAGNDMIVYSCQSVVNGTYLRYELKYELKSCKWILFKI